MASGKRKTPCGQRDHRPKSESSSQKKRKSNGDTLSSLHRSPKVEPAASMPPTQDVHIRPLMAPMSVIVPPAVTTSKSPPTAPPPLPPIFPFMVPGMGFGFPGMVTPPILVPNASADVLDVIDRDPLSTICIDGAPREIRHYSSTAVVLLNWDNPREIHFLPDNSPIRIVVNNKFTIECMLHAPDVERMVYGKLHKFRLGTPTRELYVDGIGYRCLFGESALKVNLGLDERSCSVRLKGQPPKVDIGGPKRQDLVGGKVSLYMNDKHTFQLFLDSKAQKIEVEGCKFVFMFIDSLQRVLINGVPFRADFGGIGYPFMHHSRLFFFRLSILPFGIIPGAVQIYQMMTSNLPAPPPLPPSLRSTGFPLLPVPPMMSSVSMMPVASLPAPIIMNPAEPSITTTLAATEANTSAVKTEESTADSLSIDELVQKLLAEGLVSLPEVTSTTSVGEQSPSNKPSSSRSRKLRKEANHSPKVEPVKFVDFENPDTFKQKQPGMVSLLYTGTQCASCGLRFSKERALKYSEHLDWHFRLNRRKKEESRKINSREWYCKAAVWSEVQEIEDEGDRGQNWFDKQSAKCTEETIEKAPCVEACPGLPDTCELCLDKFEQFFDQDEDAWQMKNAVVRNNKVYHPICLQGHKEEDDDVEGIVDTDEPISLTQDEPSVTEDDVNVVSVGGVASSADEEDLADCVLIEPSVVGSITIDDDDDDDDSG